MDITLVNKTINVKQEKLYLKFGGNKVHLKSGDEGLYIDIDMEDLLEKIKDHPDVMRTFTRADESEIEFVRIFVLPKKGTNGFHNYYLEVAYPKEST